MMPVPAIQKRDMHVHAGGGGKTLIELAPDVTLLTREHGRQQLVTPPLQPRAPGNIERHFGQRLVHRHAGEPHAGNALPVAHGQSERLAKAEGDVFGGVMRIDMRIALQVRDKSNPAQNAVRVSM